MNAAPQNSRQENLTMRALYLIAIVAVVDGHIELGDMFNMNSLFRYNSFHMMLFTFASGYFFSDRSSLPAEIGRRAKKMLIPLFFWNAIYGLVAAFLRKAGGFQFGQPLSAYTLLIAPMADGEHFSWNLASWYVFPLFVIQVSYLLLSRLFARVKGGEWLILALSLVGGSTAITLCRAGQTDALPLFLMRTLILLPGYAGGVLYRRRLEKHDTLPTVPYLLGLMIARALLCTPYPNMAYVVSNCRYFGCDAFGVYMGGLLAIAFFLRIARIAGPLMQRSRLLLHISRNTFDIMMHHYMGFFFLNCVFLVVHMLGIGAQDFSVNLLRTERNFCYAPDSKPEWTVLYVAAGILMPLIVVFAKDRLRALAAKIRARA